MRTYLVFIFISVCPLVAAQQVDLSQTQFKATHNSYRMLHRPSVQIDKYDVWEIELDFGMVDRSGDFFVGHDYPETHFGLTTLGDWVRDILSAESLNNHPIILKLEAKTAGACRVPVTNHRFRCASEWPEGWLGSLRDSLHTWLAPGSWITPDYFTDTLNSDWPTAVNLAGKIMVTLQDNSSNWYVDCARTWIFASDIPGLTTHWPPVESREDFETVLKTGANRITMDDAYVESWATMKHQIESEIGHK